MHEVLHVPDTFQYITFDNMVVLHLVDRLVLVLSILALQSNKQKSACWERVRERKTESVTERERWGYIDLSSFDASHDFHIYCCFWIYKYRQHTFIHRKNRYTTICIMKQNTRKKALPLLSLSSTIMCSYFEKWFFYFDVVRSLSSSSSSSSWGFATKIPSPFIRCLSIRVMQVKKKNIDRKKRTNIKINNTESLKIKVIFGIVLQSVGGFKWKWFVVRSRLAFCVAYFIYLSIFFCLFIEIEHCNPNYSAFLSDLSECRILYPSYMSVVMI